MNLERDNAPNLKEVNSLSRIRIMWELESTYMNKFDFGRVGIFFLGVTLSCGLMSGVHAAEIVPVENSDVEYNYSSMLSPFTGGDNILGILLKNPNSDIGTIATEISQKTLNDFELVEVESPQATVDTKSNVFYIPEIPLSQEIQQYIYDMCMRKNIPVDFMFTLALHESGFRTDAVSASNDYGLFQINICNHKAYAKLTGTENNPKDPYVNTIWSTTMIESYWNQWKEKYPSSLRDVIDHTLSCYNGGPRNNIITKYVNRWWENYNTIQEYFSSNGYDNLLTCASAK